MHFGMFCLRCWCSRMLLYFRNIRVFGARTCVCVRWYESFWNLELCGTFNDLLSIGVVQYYRVEK